MRPMNNDARVHKKMLCAVAGLEMCLSGQEGESQIFTIEHKSEYQKVQHKFWDAVDTMAPENLMVKSLCCTQILPDNDLSWLQYGM